VIASEAIYKSSLICFVTLFISLISFFGIGNLLLDYRYLLFENIEVFVDGERNGCIPVYMGFREYCI